MLRLWSVHNNIFKHVAIPHRGATLVVDKGLTKNPKQIFCRNMLLRHHIATGHKVVFLIVVFVILMCGVDVHLFDTLECKQVIFNTIGPLQKAVVIVARHIERVRTSSFAHGVWKTLVLKSVNAPTASAELQTLAYNIGFERIRKSAVLHIAVETYLNRAVHSLHRRFKLTNLFKPAEETLHLANQHVHLIKGGSVWQSGINVKHHLVVRLPIVAVHHLFGKKAERASKYHIGVRTERFVIKFCTKHLVINLC